MDPVLDLLLGSSCAACGRPGRALCRSCRDLLPGAAVSCWPTPTPVGLAPPVAVGEYAGALKALINAHKEQQRFALARPLGDLLARSLEAHARTPSPRGARGVPQRAVPVLVVPVPSRGGVVRRRGHDPLLRIALRAAGRLRAGGRPARVVRPLASVRRPRDQASLGAEERVTNLAGSMRCHGAVAGFLVAAIADGARVVVVDDVITTGATVREAQRALEVLGVPVHGIAVVAATRRRVHASQPHPRTEDHEV